MFLFLFLFLFMLLLCSFFRSKELFQVKNGLTTSLLFFFFFVNAKNLGRSNDAKRRKERGWHKQRKIGNFKCLLKEVRSYKILFVIKSHNRTLWLLMSFIHSFIHSLIHSFIHSFIYSFIHLSIHHALVRSFVRSFTHSFIYSLVD